MLYSVYNIKQKVFTLSYLLTMPDGTLLSFLFGEEGVGRGPASLLAVSVIQSRSS